TELRGIASQYRLNTLKYRQLRFWQETCRFGDTDFFHRLSINLYQDYRKPLLYSQNVSSLRELPFSV
ncbi:MAG: hypothetical protein R6V60_01555, partial [Desulfobacterales bacterium]